MKNNISSLSEKQYFDKFYSEMREEAFEDTPALKKFSQGLVKRIINSLKPHKNETILSLGCGNGRIELKLAPLVKKIVGLDISLKAIDNAKQKTKQLKIKNADFFVQNLQKDLPFQNKSFDKVLALGVFHHLDRINKTLKEINRVLKNGGVLYSIDPNANGILRKFGKAYFKKIYQVHRSPNEHDIDTQELIALCSKTGFIIKELNYLDFLATPFATLWPKIPVFIFDLLIRFDSIWCTTFLLKERSSSFILTCRKRTKS